MVLHPRPHAQFRVAVGGGRVDVVDTVVHEPHEELVRRGLIATVDGEGPENHGGTVMAGLTERLAVDHGGIQGLIGMVWR